MQRQLNQLSREESRGAVPLGMLRIALGSLERQMATLKKEADSRSLVKLREFLKFYLSQVITNARTKATVEQGKNLLQSIRDKLGETLRNTKSVLWEKEINKVLKQSTDVITLLENPTFRELFFTECWSVTLPVMEAISEQPNIMPYTSTSFDVQKEIEETQFSTRLNGNNRGITFITKVIILGMAKNGKKHQ